MDRMKNSQVQAWAKHDQRNNKPNCISSSFDMFHFVTNRQLATLAIEADAISTFTFTPPTCVSLLAFK